VTGELKWIDTRVDLVFGSHSPAPGPRGGLCRSGRGSSQTWKTFLHNHTAGIGAMDFLIVPTVGVRLLFVLVILSTNGGG